MPRHGKRHEYAPHTLPYLANMWALRSLGVRRIFAPCAVGSLRADWGPGTVAVPEQLVDRTSGRPQTYFDGGGVHVSFADPYCDELRGAAIGSAVEDLPMQPGGTMVVVQGPRFSTRAESRWFAGQGWDLVNMTGYPEAVLARELEMCYCAVALVTDLDAGLESGEGVHAVDVFARGRDPALRPALTVRAAGRCTLGPWTHRCGSRSSWPACGRSASPRSWPTGSCVRCARVRSSTPG
ncbi:5'-methylthioadenosine phosphorylase [Mycobacteroides abscessus subsp. abscessus]|nr:5'-methylthioadenosine phosphorylase [Mycobacteroides abscessus subsp. abscessus]